MRCRLMTLVLVALVLVLGLSSATAGAGAPPSCRAGGTAPFTVPDNACTPGAFQPFTHDEVCTSKDRDTLHAADRRAILQEYGFSTFTGVTGELDHRVPFFLGGTTDRRNIWPEVGTRPNAKDRLETAIYRRVCFGVPYRMRVRTAVRIFLSDWRYAYGPVVLGRGSLDR